MVVYSYFLGLNFLCTIRILYSSLSSYLGLSSAHTCPGNRRDVAVDNLFKRSIPVSKTSVSTRPKEGIRCCSAKANANGGSPSPERLGERDRAQVLVRALVLWAIIYLQPRRCGGRFAQRDCKKNGPAGDALREITCNDKTREAQDILDFCWMFESTGLR